MSSGMEDSEELRETVIAMQREIAMLSTESRHANLLLSALDAVLATDAGVDPFAGVFAALMPVFRSTLAVVLMERKRNPRILECIAASAAAATGSKWQTDALFERVLGGRIVATVAGTGQVAVPDGLAALVSASQPALCIPLSVRHRRGMMLVLRADGAEGFDRTDVALARKFSILASHAFAARQANLTEVESQRLKELTRKLQASREALRFRANHDGLTGLANRSHVEQQVNARIAQKQPGEKLALAFIDLDGFKRVNDLNGHATGDALLQEIARRIQSQVRDTDICGRISGDEFIIMLDPVPRRSDVLHIINRVCTELQRPFRAQGAEFHPSASVGVAFYPMQGDKYEMLRRHADLAMYRAKTTNKGGITFFTQRIGRQADATLALEARLRQAVARREFRCALQEKVAMDDGRIIGFEALCRWVDADGTLHLPGSFLPVAAGLGLLDAIAMQVAADLVAALPALDRRYGTDVHYSLNISPAQATNLPFLRRLIAELQAAPAARFIFELTEEAVVATTTFEEQVLPLLRTAGIGLSVDDFGTGYSSLAKIATLTADELKIDRSLITSIHARPRNQSILRAIDSLGSALDMMIVAEGIETSEECSYLLQNTGIRVGQGYRFHRPQLLDCLLAPPHPLQPALAQPLRRAG